MNELTFEKICDDISELISFVPNLLEFDSKKGFVPNAENVKSFKESFVLYVDNEEVRKRLEERLKPERENLYVVFMILNKPKKLYPQMIVFFSKFNFVVPKFINSLVASKYINFDIPYWCQSEEEVDDIFEYFGINDALSEAKELDDKFVFRIRVNDEISC